MDQRPSSQLKEVAEGIISGWGGLDGKSYAVRLTILCGFFFTVIAYPIASETYNPEIQWTEAHVAAMLGSLVAVTAITLTIHNSWDYVRNRLLSANIEYEESGWYDGQVYVKTPEMLAKDRLDGTYVCGPVVERCKRTMLACGAGVFGCALRWSWKPSKLARKTWIIHAAESGSVERFRHGNVHRRRRR